MHLNIGMTYNGDLLDDAERVQLRLAVNGDELIIEVAAPYHGDPAPDGAPGPTWQLWEHEVVELFVLGEDDRYTEIELSPHGHHLVLRLEGERNMVERMLPLSFAALIAGTRWTATARIPLTLLPQRPWRGHACAIHGLGEERRYLVSTVLGTEQPDFHCLSAFPILMP